MTEYEARQYLMGKVQEVASTYPDTLKIVGENISEGTDETDTYLELQMTMLPGWQLDMAAQPWIRQPGTLLLLLRVRPGAGALVSSKVFSHFIPNLERLRYQELITFAGFTLGAKSGQQVPQWETFAAAVPFRFDRLALN